MARGLRRILLVEDDKDIASLVAMVLGQHAGYTVKACLSARHALEAVDAFGPDLILLDVMMPEADGLSALKGLRTRRSVRDTPVVFLTAMAAPSDIARFEAHGALGVITKPFDPLTLAPTLEKLWSRRPAPAAPAFNAVFEGLRRDYLAQLPERIAALRAAADAARDTGWDRPRTEWLHLEAHRLAGSAGIYHLAGLSQAAVVLEQWLKRLLSGPWPPAAAPGELVTLVKAVRRVARDEARVLGQRPSAAAPPETVPDLPDVRPR